MSFYTVTRDDLRNVRRSYVVLGVVGVFTALVALVFGSEISIYDDAYRTLYDVSALVGFAFPLFVASLTYLSIAGDRSGGAIKYVLGLPNSRAEYFLGKYVSRAVVAVSAVVLATVVGFVIAAATFTNGADPIRFLKFAAVSALYALTVTGIFVSLSATTASRSRAMFAVIGAYFVLVPFWFGFLPVISLDTVIDALTSTLGITLSESTRELVSVLSPATAYLQATEVVYAGVFDQYQILGTFHHESDRLARQSWFNVLVLGCWATVAPLLGYLKFRVSELG
ncbi:ABC transporter permease [Halomicrococcus sp. SG-WS-1]|uniref:ABC transporter permease n=1 Tax=Halomicrococcus sp. SG-WS-1 TaxID=3439057 RepID=UPI003F7AE3DF